MDIQSVYEITDLKTGKQYEEHIEGAGQNIIKSLRKRYPFFTKFVLSGFNVDGVFKPLRFFTYNNFARKKYD